MPRSPPTPSPFGGGSARCRRISILLRVPVWPNAPGLNGLVLVGYTPAGQQVRVSWFEHARLD